MTSLLRLMVQLARCTSGSALLEMTIVTPVAIALAAGAVDFGMAFSTQASLGKAARDAARYLAGLPTPVYQQCSTASTPCWAILYVRNILVKSIMPSANVTVTYPACSSPPFPTTTNCVKVQVQYTYNSIILASFLPIASQYVLSAEDEEVQVGG